MRPDQINKKSTARLALVTLLMSLSLALAMALTAAAYAGGWPDRAMKLLTQLGASMPAFLLGLLSLQFFVLSSGVGRVLSGGTMIEAIFTWPGLGGYVISAINARDLPVIQGFVILSTLTFVGVTGLTDVISAMIDPRLREAARV